MMPTLTQGATHNFQAPSNWDEAANGPCGDLQVRAEVWGENNVVELFSTWKPTAEELAHLNAGGVVEVGICAASQPVMSVRTVNPVEQALAEYLAPEQRPAAITINEDGHGLGYDEHGAATP